MPFSENWGNGLVLRSIRDESDVDRFVAFNTQYNNVNEGQTCDCVLRHHPGARWEDFWLVEDESRGEIVSTTCLIPWTCRYGDIRAARGDVGDGADPPGLPRPGIGAQTNAAFPAGGSFAWLRPEHHLGHPLLLPPVWLWLLPGW